MREQLYIFLNAVMFFTRVPVPSWTPFSQGYLNRASRYFPLVGWLVGGFGALVLWAALAAFPPLVAVTLSVLATTLLTGAFHEDGLADACDGLGGGWDRAQVLAIMKDSRLGSYGAVGLGLALALKIFSLSHLPFELAGPALVAGHALSRFGAASLIRLSQYARQDEDSKAKPLASRMGVGDFIIAALFGLAPVVMLPRLSAAAAVLGVAIAVWLMKRYFERRIGGYTGDCLGAAQQATELLIYLVVLGAA